MKNRVSTDGANNAKLCGVSELLLPSGPDLASSFYTI